METGDSTREKPTGAGVYTEGAQEVDVTNTAGAGAAKMFATIQVCESMCISVR